MFGRLTGSHTLFFRVGPTPPVHLGPAIISDCFFKTEFGNGIDAIPINQESKITEESFTFPGITFLKEAGIIPEEGKIKIPSFGEAL